VLVEETHEKPIARLDLDDPKYVSLLKDGYRFVNVFCGTQPQQLEPGETLCHVVFEYRDSPALRVCGAKIVPDEEGGAANGELPNPGALSFALRCVKFTPVAVNVTVTEKSPFTSLRWPGTGLNRGRQPFHGLNNLFFQLLRRLHGSPKYSEIRVIRDNHG
jgi:hypothetical protein